MKISTATRRYILAAKAYGHECKGKGKRNASKARRRLGKALCENSNN